MKASFRVCSSVLFSVAPAAAQRWIPIASGSHPPNDAYVAMAYDSVRQRPVLMAWDYLYPFGFGITGQATLWEWDGSGWLRQPQPSVGSGQRHAAAFDPIRKRVIFVSNTGLTSSYDGRTWQVDNTPQLTIDEPSLAFDHSRNVMVLADSGYAHELQGNAWVRIASQTPLPFRATRIGFDPVGNRIIGFGGYSLPVWSNGTWSWDGVQWTALSPSTVPAARHEHQMVNDPVTGRLLMIGGVDYPNSQRLGDVQEWTGTDWQLRGQLPAPRTRHAAARTADGIVVFGGSTNNPANGGFTPSTMVSTAGGPFVERGEAAGELVAHDAVRHRSVSLVGQRTVEFDGFAWRDVGIAFPATATALGFHAATARCIALDNTGGTWSFDGVQWTSIPTTQSPGSRLGAAVADDPVRGRLVLFGGKVAGVPTNDLWEWDGLDWSLRPQIGAPSAAEWVSTCWHQPSQKVLLARGSLVATFLGILGWDGTAWSSTPFTLDIFTSFVLQPRIGSDPALGVTVTGTNGFTTTPNTAVSQSFLLGPTQSFPYPFSDFRRNNGPIVYDTNRGALVQHDSLKGLDYVFTVAPSVATTYGSGCAGSGLAPSLVGASLPHVGTNFSLDVYDGTPNSIAAWFAGFAQSSSPLGGGCTLLVDQPFVLALGTTNAFGFGSVSWPVPPTFGLIGLSAFVQVAVVQPGGPVAGFLSVTNGLQMRIGQ